MHPNDMRGRDPWTSRQYKRHTRKEGADPVEQAYCWGQNCPKRRNPYPAGRRHDAFKAGQANPARIF